jgi:hypothetical protein
MDPIDSADLVVRPWSDSSCTFLVVKDRWDRSRVRITSDELLQRMRRRAPQTIVILSDDPPEVTVTSEDPPFTHVVIGTVPEVPSITPKKRKKTDLTEEIKKLSAVTRDLLHDADPATRKAVLLLISHTCGLKQKDVKKVLEAASHLARKYAP